MKSKFSTLLAAALVAGSFSFNAQAAISGAPGDVKTGDIVYLSNETNLLSVNGTGLALTTTETPTSLDAAQNALWIVTVHSVAGTQSKLYSFVNKATGKTLSLDPKADIKSVATVTTTRKAVLANNGVSLWSWASDGNLSSYCNRSGSVKTDSVYTIAASGAELIVTNGTVASPEPTVPAGLKVKIVTPSVLDLKVATSSTTGADIKALNEFLNGKGGSTFGLYFNKKDVSKDQNNIFAGNTNLKAVAISTTADQFAIQTGETIEGAEDVTTAEETGEKVQKPYYIVADTFMYSGGNNYIKFGRDTLDTEAVLGENGVVTTAADAAKRRGLPTYLFTAQYDVVKDSLMLKVVGVAHKQATQDATAGDTEGSWWTTGGVTNYVKYYGTVATTTSAATPVAFQVGTLSLEGVTVLAPVLKSAETAYTAADNILPLIQPFKTSPVVGGDATFTDDQLKAVYFVKYLSDKKENEAKNGKYVTLTTKGDAVDYTAAPSVAVPADQFVLAKGAGEHVYVLTNREDVAVGGWNAGFYTVDKDNMIYAANGDTIQLEVAAADKSDKYLGYLNISAFDQANKSYNVTSGSVYMKGLGLSMLADSSLVMAEDEGIVFRLTAAGDPVKNEKTGLEKQAYKLSNNKGEYIAVKSGRYVMTNKGIVASSFYLKNMESDSTYVIIENAATLANKLGVNAQTGVVTRPAITAVNDLFVIKSEAAPVSLISDPVHKTISSGAEFVVMGQDMFAYVARENDPLKSEVYTKDDLKMWLDTAKVVRGGVKVETPEYYVSKGGNYMVALADSTKEEYLYSGATRLAFMEATKAGMDTLLVKSFDGKTDSVCLKADAKKGQKGGLNNFRFTFTLADKDVKDEYVMTTAAGQKVVNVNGVLVADKNATAPMVVALATSAAPVGNEDITTTTVQVVAGEGCVTVYGAAGKKVVVSDVLGRTTTVVATSDSQAVAVASGVAIIAVEGEAAVKAIVK